MWTTSSRIRSPRSKSGSCATTWKPKKNEKFEVDLAPLHDKLETSVRESYDAARRVIDEQLSHCMTECHKVVSEHFDERLEDISLDELPYDSFTTTLAMSKKTLQTDFVNERTWAFWKRKSVDKNKTFEAMRVLAVAELRPAIEKLPWGL